jgi:hypothetical protein
MFCLGKDSPMPPTKGKMESISSTINNPKKLEAASANRELSSGQQLQRRTKFVSSVAIH